VNTIVKYKAKSFTLIICLHYISCFLNNNYNDFIFQIDLLKGTLFVILKLI